MKPFLSIKEIQTKIKNKEISPQDSLYFFRKRLTKFAPKLNALIELFHEDSTGEKESKEGLLGGIPGVLKDNITQKGRITSCASKILENYKATYDATVTTRLKQAGGIILGRANMDEFAMGASGEFSPYGPTFNPWDAKRSPGGSSAGPAAAVAAGLVPWAIGTETGGSVRQPASFCGIVGLYPTYGRFSRRGLVAFTSSTDQPGPLTRTVYDNAILASILSGHDPKDGTSISKPQQNFTEGLDGKFPKDLKIGIIKDSFESDGVDPQIKTVFEQAVKEIEKLGAKTKIIELPELKYGNSIYFIISRAEAASNLSRFDGTLYGNRIKNAENLEQMYVKTRGEGFGAEVKRRILMGNYVLSSGHKEAFYFKANQVRNLLRSEFESAFEDVDLLISPTTTTLPFEIGKEISDPLALYMADYFTVPMCVAGIPALTLPCGFSKENLPIGLQFVGPRLSEGLIYKVAHAYQESTEHHLKTPSGF
ncbi:Asp-tRNA(Asn)/Glu-tRNA(Gln) amidotransferase subunit GatA [Candidatus Babeliales bacterium]|nr:Asp-tRNA(Asn)/Glu-tRNA(Gln) amidotransferase subunit GatA [Candidatus Babeliales bacterium]